MGSVMSKDEIYHACGELFALIMERDINNVIINVGFDLCERELRLQELVYFCNHGVYP